MARRGKARHGRLGTVRLGRAWHGSAGEVFKNDGGICNRPTSFKANKVAGFEK